MVKDKYLPDNFIEIIQSANLEELKKTFDMCDINATTIIDNRSALSFRNITNGFVIWLIENGADINTINIESQSPLDLQTMQYQTSLDVLETLIHSGADINALDRHNNTPLHYALSPKKATLLLKYGADPLKTNKYGEMPLECIFSHYGSYINIIDLAESAEILLNKGNVITNKMKKEVDIICNDAQLYSKSYKTEDLPQVNQSIIKLKKLFSVTPIADKYSFENLPKFIEIKSENVNEKFNELWDLLVPQNGKSSCIQGELIRISGRIGYEILSNGGFNWDKDYKKMLDFFNKTIKTENPLSEIDIDKVNTLSKHILGLKNINEDIIDELYQLGIKWILKNLTPIKLGKITYKR